MIPMEWSEDGRTKLTSALAKAQAKMTAVVKAAKNPAFSSRYADLATVLDAVLPALNENGFALVQSPSFDGEVVTVETFLAHSDGGWLRSVLSLRPARADPQGVGSAVTYGRRYSLMALTGVAPEDDDGNAASGQGPQTSGPAPGKKFEPRGAKPKAPPAADAPKTEPPPAAQPVDRSAEPVPTPETDDPEEWTSWRKIVASKISKAPDLEALNKIQTVNMDAIVACNAILPDTIERMAEFVEKTRVQIEGEPA